MYYKNQDVVKLLDKNSTKPLREFLYSNSFTTLQSAKHILAIMKKLILILLWTKEEQLVHHFAKCQAIMKKLILILLWTKEEALGHSSNSSSSSQFH
ncbi:hypothetical protein DEO72_LG8g2938 [Vigna unguiculata]|uniref:Uncharacterized protein n=1 Tax=Vigna unguiculata TaxID=3917 RepID=A0A4D6MYF1_VIGUN|nr:hypothetical protein DEO72_LG8g2938 [Vigna unguiculata]